MFWVSYVHPGLKFGTLRQYDDNPLQAEPNTKMTAILHTTLLKALSRVNDILTEMIMKCGTICLNDNISTAVCAEKEAITGPMMTQFVDTYIHLPDY